MSLNAAIPSGDKEDALAGVLGASSMWSLQSPPCPSTQASVCTAQGLACALGPITHKSEQLTVKRGLHRHLHPHTGCPTAV